MKLLFSALLCAMVCAAAFPARALVLTTYSPVRHDRFSSGWSAGAPVPNTDSQFIGLSYDWSGVGWDANSSQTYLNVAMISLTHFVYAAHRPPSTTLKFLRPTDNTVVSYTWSGSGQTLLDPWTGEASDFAIGTLSGTGLTPADGIAIYPILFLGPEANYMGLPLLTYGRGHESSPRIGADTVAGFDHLDINKNSTLDTYTVYHFQTAGGDTTRYEGGDSDSPLFVPFRGELAIIGTHSSVSATSPYKSWDNFIPVYIPQMIQKGITFTTVPEPEFAGAFFLLAALCAGRMLRRGTNRPNANLN